MDKIKTKAIIRKYSLIPSKASKAILKSIREDKNFISTFKDFITEIDYKNLKNKYKEKVLYLKNNKIVILPKNLPFLYLIKDETADFSWKINEPSTISNNNTDLVLKTTNVEGVNPSLLSIILNLVKKELHNHHHYPEFLEINKTSKSLILELFNKVKFASRLSDITPSLNSCIQKAIKSKKINILTPLCPDYSNIDLGKGLYTLTFDGLGSDIGVTAKRLLENLECLHSVFKQHDIKVTHTAAIGDFEALSEDTCKRVNLSRKKFIEHLIVSQKKLKEYAGEKLKTILFTDLCNGLDNWIKIHSKYYEMLLNKDFGKINLSNNDIENISNSRKPLLYRWFGKISDEELLKVVLWQGAEYATMGHIIDEVIENPVIIGADHVKMAPFYGISSSVPILYLTSNYIRN